MSEEIDHCLEDDLHDRRLGLEGYQTGGWILQDYGDIVIHLFDAKTREYYRLDELWTGAKRVPFTPKDPFETVTAFAAGYWSRVEFVETVEAVG